MSPRAARRMHATPPDADADYLRAWNEGWESAWKHAEAKAQRKAFADGPLQWQNYTATYNEKRKR